MTIWAYARVSTRDQNPQLQLDALAASGYDELIMEKESGKRGVARSAWEALPALPKAGDTLKFWKSDRRDRSAGHVLAMVNELRDRGITVVSLTENFDLGTKEGRFMFAVLAAAAEYELELRAERQAEGIAAARRREATGAMLSGKKKTGRPRASASPSRPHYAAWSMTVSRSSRPPAPSKSAAPPPTRYSRDAGRQLFHPYPTSSLGRPSKIVLIDNGCPAVPQPRGCGRGGE
ncbi:recombinase family protein [Streptosporangium sp. CA-135522]|uniref:recombinase family protein n=1 Tax=Streptosporangium sp. CA-135522 TaxID=3240072 RepID=UPI003D8CF7DB